ncbi:hypothetical protein C8T65DRAFT_671481 [Cerioporus squamosus]|nr:hypothetical protein C8T65DRAFT_671481 [Cerioporus squamosus]
MAQTTHTVLSHMPPHRSRILRTHTLLVYMLHAISLLLASPPYRIASQPYYHTIIVCGHLALVYAVCSCIYTRITVPV